MKRVSRNIFKLKFWLYNIQQIYFLIFIYVSIKQCDIFFFNEIICIFNQFYRLKEFVIGSLKCVMLIFLDYDYLRRG